MDTIGWIKRLRVQAIDRELAGLRAKLLAAQRGRASWSVNTAPA